MTSAEFNKYLKNPGFLNVQSLEATENLTKEFPAFEFGWALWLKNLKNIGDSRYQELLPKVSIRVSDRRWLKKFLETPIAAENQESIADDYLEHIGYTLISDENTEEIIEDSKDAKRQLIENFLATGTDLRGKPNQDETAAAAELAEKSVLENEDIVTETYANILLSQGKLEKAMDVFQKLSLRNPEKSIYFATRIKEIRLLLNN